MRSNMTLMKLSVEGGSVLRTTTGLDFVEEKQEDTKRRKSWMTSSNIQKMLWSRDQTSTFEATLPPHHTENAVLTLKHGGVSTMVWCFPLVVTGKLVRAEGRLVWK